MPRIFIALFLLLVYSNVYATNDEGCRGNCRQDQGGGVDVDVRTGPAVAINLTTTETTTTTDTRSEATGINGDVISEGGRATATIASGAVLVKAGDTGPSTSSVGDIETGGVEDSGNSTVNIHGNSYPKQVPDAYFNYTPNFISCGRVIGFQYGNTSGIGSLGIPWFRDKSCDIWLAVNEAQENGHTLLSYAFMCEIKNIKEVWGKERCNEITDTANRWWEASLPVPPEDPEITSAYSTVAGSDCEGDCKHAGWLVAEITEEQYYEQQQVVEDKNNQQQNLIESLKQREADLSQQVKSLKQIQQERLATEDAKKLLLMDLLEKKEDG